MKPKPPHTPAAPDGLSPTLFKVLVFGFHDQSKLTREDFREIGEREWWALDDAALEALYARHRHTVDAEATRADLAEPWVVGELRDRAAREAASQQWLNRDE